MRIAVIIIIKGLPSRKGIATRIAKVHGKCASKKVCCFRISQPRMIKIPNRAKILPNMTQKVKSLRNAVKNQEKNYGIAIKMSGKWFSLAMT